MNNLFMATKIQTEEELQFVDPIGIADKEVENNHIAPPSVNLAEWLTHAHSAEEVAQMLNTKGNLDQYDTTSDETTISEDARASADEAKYGATLITPYEKDKIDELKEE